jgi:acyl-CoA thioester hydrolase
MSTSTHEYKVFIQESHLDTFGHVNNATYLQIFEEARWDLIDGRGYGMKKINESRLGPVILEAHVKFRREVKNRTPIIVRTDLLEYKGKIGKLRQRVFKQDEGVSNQDDASNQNSDELACEAVFKIALWNIDERKLVAPTPEWSHAIMHRP